MDTVFLRVYNREIESMIEGGQLDEAVAHCQHILKTYPMHLETYRLLGKSFLEARRYTDAADIFERVLMAVPDDFVSHVGMSIIRDDQGRLDDAIWHMERAFEVQPSNSAIQGELRRLFGRRDGVEPSKIRLSRDALANMYSQGELFNQAIAEIRSVLADDQNRPDLQVMLARAYYRSGQKVEAAEIAAGLLKKYPYCMDALRILVDVLPGTARADNGPVYRNRLQQLDPYSSFAIDSVFASDKVADSAVNIERLDYRSGAMPAGPKPDWSSSLGIKVNPEKQAEVIPEWMQSSQAAEETAASTPPALEPGPVAANDGAESAIPEWMRSAGWQDSTGKAEEVPANAGEELPQEPIAKAEIPEWLMSMAPAEASDKAEKQPEEPVEALPMNEAGFPDWLTPMSSADKAGPEQPESSETVEPRPISSEDLPDWLTPMGSADKAEAEQPASSEKAEPQPVGGEDLPDFLKPISPDETPRILPVELSKASGSKYTPDLSVWDQDEQMDTANPVKDGQKEPPNPVEIQPAEEDNIPDWLKGIAPAGAAAVASFTTQEPAGQQPESREDVPEGLKPVDSADTFISMHDEPKQPIESQSAQADDIPDWLKSIAPRPSVDETPMEPQKPGEPQAAMGIDTPDWLTSLAQTDTPGEENKEPQSPAETQPESMGNADAGWLSSLAADESLGEEHKAPQLPVEPQPQNMESNLPDWLASLTADEPLGEEHKEPQAPVEPQPESMEGAAPDWLSSLAPAETSAEEQNEPQPPVESQPESLDNAVPDWLSSLAPAETSAAEQREPQLPVEPQPESLENTVPDWLSSVNPSVTSAEEHPEAQAPVEPQPESMESGLPDWLSSLNPAGASAEEHLEPQQPVEAQPSEENVPDWLKLIRQKQDETAQPAESELVDLPETSGRLESVLPQEAAVEPNAVPEPTMFEEHVTGSSFEPPTAASPIEGAEAFPDFLTGMGARAAAAAAAASEAMNLAKTSEQPVIEQPAAEQPVIEQPVAERPVTEQPVAEQSVTEQPVPQQPVEQEPIVEKPVVQEPFKASSTQTAGETFRPSGEVKPLNIEDDAMGWLESLAAKQGAKPEELLTNPLDRSAEMPDWLRHPDEPVVESPAPADQETPRSPGTTLPLEPLGLYAKAAEPTPSTPPDEPVSALEGVPPSEEKPEMADQEEDQLAWLEELSGSEETKTEEETVGSIPAQEPAPDWTKVEADEYPVVSTPEETIPSAPDSIADESDITITSWLNKKDVEEAIGKQPSETPSNGEAAAPAEELPDWLKDIEKPVAPVESSKPAEDLPEWLRQPATLDKVESGPEPAMPAWVDENIPVDGQAIPTVPEEWVPAEAKPEEHPEPLAHLESLQAVEPPPVSEPFPASEIVPPAEPTAPLEPVSFVAKPPVVPPTLKQTGMLSVVPVHDKDAELLSNAQQVLDQNSLTSQ